MRTFAERLLISIEDRKTSQAEVARKAGISGASVSDWATGKVQPDHIKAAPLLKAATFLQVEPLWLLLGIGRRSTHSAPALSLTATEPAPSYRDWPFDGIDQKLVAKLQPREVIQIEGAWLLAAKQLGFSLGKQAAA